MGSRAAARMIDDCPPPAFLSSVLHPARTPRLLKLFKQNKKNLKGGETSLQYEILQR